MSRFRIYGETDIGRVRENNQDSIEWFLSPDEEVGLAVLADGVGGYAGGEVASRLAVEHAHGLISRKAQDDVKAWRAGRGRMVWRMIDAVDEANRAIFDVRKKNPELSRMGTTLVMTMLHDDQVGIAHVGDSRCYLFRDGQLQQLTQDHSMAQELRNSGGLPTSASVPYQNILTKTLGIDACVEPDVQVKDSRVGDIYLLCSDGLTNNLSDENIITILAGEEGLAQSVSKLVDAANDAGGSDNISVLLVERTD